ncbi:MAG: histidine phosphatase family protein [Pyrinomonadaceae bacterium]
MNYLRFLLVFSGLVCALGFSIQAQSKNKTIVLVRHAEKVAAPPTEPDPELSPEGRSRAERFMKAVARRYKPHEIFSTNYKRTRQTAEPVAAKRKKEIQTYDPSKHAEFVEKIMASDTDHYLIVGHSNTIPALANMIAKKQVFRNLLESEYGVYWVIRLKHGVLQRIEVFTF